MEERIMRPMILVRKYQKEEEMDTVNKAITVYHDKNGKEITEEEYWKILKEIMKGSTHELVSRCEKCGKDFDPNIEHCPECGLYMKLLFKHREDECPGS